MRKRYKLIEDNKFYGKKGDYLSREVYEKIPRHHQKLFEEECTVNKTVHEKGFKSIVGKLNKPEGLEEILEDAFRHQYVITANDFEEDFEEDYDYEEEDEDDYEF